MAAVLKSNAAATSHRNYHNKRNKSLEHEIMVQRLAAWKAEKAQKQQQNTDNRQPSTRASNPSTQRQPLKETTQTTTAHCTSLNNDLSSNKSRKSQKHPSGKKDATSSFLIREHPSSKKVQPLASSSFRVLKDGGEVSGTPKKHLFTCPTPLKSNGLRSGNLLASGSTLQDAHLMNESQVAEPLKGGPNSSVTSPPSRKRKAVSFANNTPVRCSPRLHKQSETTEAIMKGATSEVSTPNQPWQDKNVDMRKRLEMWLATKGKTPSRYSNLLNFKKTPADERRQRKISARRATPAKRVSPVWQLDPDESTTSRPQEEEEDELTAALNSTMDECFLLLQSGCPTSHVTEWLDSLVSKVPALHRCAKYWLCRVALAKEERRDANEIINIYEDAVQDGAQPIHAVKDSLLKYVTELVTPTMPPQDLTPDPLDVEAHLSSSSSPNPHARMPETHLVPSVVKQLLQSSVLKYCLTESTPYFDRIRQAIGHQVPVTPLRLTFVTPVRRSTRIEGRRSLLPLNLQDHDVCLASLEQLPSSGPQEFILRTNLALEDQFLDEQGDSLESETDSF